MNLLVTLFLFIAIDLTDANAEVKTSTMSPQSQSQPPLCVDDPKILENIQQTLDANQPAKGDSKAVKKKKQARRYDGYKQALASIDDQELFTRLAYAETLAANCAQQNAQIATRIVNVIGNRVQKRNGDVKSVVYQPSQFASSLHTYGSAKFKDFLCPKDETLWKDVSTKVQNFMTKGSGDLSSDTVNYFLYKHDKRWTKEPDSWSKLAENTSGASSELRTCLRTFDVPNWK